MSYEIYTKLIESVVEPVLFYCSGIWGTCKFPKVQRVLNKACRYFLGVSKNASSTASRGDMGWVSAEVKQKIKCVRLWCRLKLCQRIEQHIRFINGHSQCGAHGKILC